MGTPRSGKSSRKKLHLERGESSGEKSPAGGSARKEETQL